MTGSFFAVKSVQITHPLKFEITVIAPVLPEVHKPPELLLRHSENFKSDKIYRNVDCWVVQLSSFSPKVIHNHDGLSSSGKN